MIKERFEGLTEANGTPINPSVKQLVANQVNAKKSTGPKSPAGKLTVAKNGIEHGIYALCPVIEEVEAKRDWNSYRKAMLTSLAPVRMLESTLTERIILTSWRLRRAARYETEQIRLTQERAEEVVGDRIGREITTSGVENILSDAERQT